MKRIYGKNSSGFSIMEAVVSAAVFATVVVSSMGVYLATVKLDAKSRAERSVQQNARFIMDFIAKEVRNGSIDYGATQGAHRLVLVNQQDQQEIFELGGTDLEFDKPAIGVTTLNSDDVRVTRFDVYLNPASNPFVLANDVHIQPHVTVVMRLESTFAKNTESSSIDVQSTFAVREYPSRQP